LASKGHAVSVFEKNSYPGGKLSELKLGAYRFDKGPSLFTLPELVDELSSLSKLDKNSFTYRRLEEITNYFFDDGTRFKAFSNPDKFAQELEEKLGEDKAFVLKHLKKSGFFYNTVRGLFLEQSLSRFKNLFRFATLRGLLRAPYLHLLSSMHEINAGRFKNPKTVQMFDRYATYNGSDPYRAPALLNLIPHLEFNLGAYLPDRGMHQITEHLYELAKNLGVEFYFNHVVEKIILNGNRACGLISNGLSFASDIVLSDMDMSAFYKNLLPSEFAPKKLLEQEKSSSAFVFYWGIKKEFSELGLHNILFSNNYKEEFRCLFQEQAPYHDPTIYINITSKYCKEDAPNGCENWFVMINVPHNKRREQIPYTAALRKHVVDKINRVLKTNIEDLIDAEAILDPHGIELQTSSVGGSLYGNASNSRFSAFLRHANFSKKIKGLYFAGGSVHPGGGIPLCLLSAKIVTQLIEEREK
jgi:phytoene desaturase